MPRIKLGVNLLITAESVPITVLARKVEELGFESLWLPEHPVMPVHTMTAYPGSPDGIIPEYYAHMVDPFIGLAMAAAVTRDLKLGTGICLVPEHNPLLLAKQVATLDRFSGGRFIFGIGTGWLREETEIMGGDFPHRWSQAKESILAMKKLWTKEEAEYQGRYYDFPPVRSNPKPAQRPHPPVILGGFAKNVLKRVVEWGDGWIPTGISPEELKAGRTKLDELATAAGRDPKSIQIIASGQPPDPELVKRLDESGADRVVIWQTKTVGQEALDQLESIAEAMLK